MTESEALKCAAGCLRAVLRNATADQYNKDPVYKRGEEAIVVLQKMITAAEKQEGVKVSSRKRFIEEVRLATQATSISDLCHYYNLMTSPSTHRTDEEHRVATWTAKCIKRRLGAEFPGQWFEKEDGKLFFSLNGNRGLIKCSQCGWQTSGGVCVECGEPPPKTKEDKR